MSRNHALLSASGASKWLNCTPSAKMESTYSESNSVYADEGTLAHDLAETLLKLELNFITPAEAKIKIADIEESEYWNAEMDEYVNEYVDYCLERYNSYKKVDIGIEETVHLEPFIPGGYSHLDCRILGGKVVYDTLEIIDLKYGKGVPVQAEGNKQALVYALGAYLDHYFYSDIQTIKITIYQPRINNITQWQLSKEELLRWANEELAPKAKIAYEGKGELKAGEWCRFCKAKHNCRAFAELNLNLAKLDFEGLMLADDAGAGIDGPTPALLSDYELSLIIRNAAIFKNWLSGILDYALKEALNGKQWPGLKVVRGRSIRRYTDTAKALETLSKHYDEMFYTNAKIKGVTELEKLLGKDKFIELLGPYVEKPEGGPSLVLDTDKRPAFDKTEEAKNDFENL